MNSCLLTHGMPGPYRGFVAHGHNYCRQRDVFLNYGALACLQKLFYRIFLAHEVGKIWRKPPIVIAECTSDRHLLVTDDCYGLRSTRLVLYSGRTSMNESYRISATLFTGYVLISGFPSVLCCAFSSEKDFTAGRSPLQNFPS